MRAYFIQDGQQEIGPLRLEDLKGKSVSATTPIWYEGLSEWTTAIKVEEVKTFLQLSVQPPTFNKPPITPPPFSHPTSSLSSKKKSNLGRNTVIGLGVVAFLFMGLLLVGYAFADDESTDSVFIEEVEEAAPDVALEELTIKNRNYRNNYEKYITVNTNQYTVDQLLGGISNLDVIVSNTTEYTIDEVIVTIDYLQKNGAIFKSEEVIIYNIPPNQDKSISAPDSNRGTSVQTRLDAITSKKMHFCFYATNGIGTYTEPENPKDPYFCK
jgi:hypothetical protein